MAKPKILLVTTDQELAQSAKSDLAKSFAVTHVDSAEEGLQILRRDSRFMVVLSGMSLPGKNGQEFLETVSKTHPKIMRIMITGDRNFETAILTVNNAHVSSILTKPCPPEKLKQVLIDAVKHYKQKQADTDAMKDTLLGCVKMLVEVLEMTNPTAVQRSKRIRRRAQKVCTDLKAMPAQFMDMVVLLSNIGCVGFPSSLLKKIEKGKNVTKEDMKKFRTHPSIAAHLLKNIPRMGKIAEIILHQNTPSSKKPPVPARILKACIDMDRMENSGASPAKAIEFMRDKPEVYDKNVVKSLALHLDQSDKAICTQVSVAELEPGMVMQTDMVTEKGAVLLSKGETLSEASHLRILNFADLLKIKEPVCAAMP